jgi:hypothetical protein
LEEWFQSDPCLLWHRMMRCSQVCRWLFDLADCKCRGSRSCWRSNRTENMVNVNKPLLIYCFGHCHCLKSNFFKQMMTPGRSWNRNMESEIPMVQWFKHV